MVSPGVLRGLLTTSARHTSFHSPGRIQSPPESSAGTSGRLCQSLSDASRHTHEVNVDGPFAGLLSYTSTLLTTTPNKSPRIPRRYLHRLCPLRARAGQVDQLTERLSRPPGDHQVPVLWLTRLSLPSSRIRWLAGIPSSPEEAPRHEQSSRAYPSLRLIRASLRAASVQRWREGRPTQTTSAIPNHRPAALLTITLRRAWPGLECPRERTPSARAQHT